MTKTSFAKRLLSVLLSVLMIVTSIPFTAITASARETGLAEVDPYWTRVASSSFDQTTNIGSANNRAYSFAQSPTLNGNDYAMTWSGVDYNSAMSSDGSGLYVDDGYIYLSGYNGNTTTPVTGKANFKIDVELEWTVENSNANSQRYCTLQLANGTALGKTSATMGSSASNIIAQDYYGKVYVGTNGYGTDGTSNCISPYSANLTTGKKYHYIMTYANKTLKTYVTDENYTVMQDVCTVENVNIDTSAINSICLGDDDTSYYFHNTKYHSITFYEGKTTSKNTVDTANSKYLFAYFTGNASNDESLHLAVSTDGMQWKTLNKNFPVWNGTAATNVYPNNNGSVAATTHIRDPYIMRAQDGSYYVFATDLDTQGGTNWGNNSKMHVFKASSIADFKDGTVEHWDIDMQDTMRTVLGGNTIRTWAPQAIYDPEYGQYMLYWSAATDSYGTTSMYYVYTTDFKTFTTTPKRLISPIGAGDNGDLNQANIDGDIYYNGQFYYLWFKNEATASIAVMTSESPSGPYTNLKSFSYSQALEGPQIYQLQNNQYILLADAYNNYCYRAFLSNTVDGFTAQSEISNTNINSLQPRHGAVIQIDDTEYNSLVNTFGIDPDDGVVRYEFSLDHENNSNTYAGGIWEGNQYQYDIGYRNEDSSTARMGNGKAVLSGKNLFINDTNVRSIIQNPTFTYSFKFKLTQNVADKNPVIFATCNPTTDYVQLLEDGTFSVNGKTCTKQANIVVGEEHTYTIAYSGVDETAILLQDGNLVGAIPTGSMDNTGARFVGLGFSDVMSGEGRIYGEYSALTFQKSIPDAVKTKLEENIVDTSLQEIHEAKGTLKNSDVNAKTIESFDNDAYYTGNGNTYTATTYHKNIIYGSKTTNFGSNNTENYLNKKAVLPSKTVLFYDGIDTPAYPVYYELSSGGKSKIILSYIGFVGTGPFEMKSNWTGSYSGDWGNNIFNLNYSLNVRNALGYTGSKGTVGTGEFSFVQGTYGTSSHFINNSMYYNGTGNTDAYYEKYENGDYVKFRVGHRNENWGWKNRTLDQTVNNTVYVLNYKPIRDIINGIVTPTVDSNTYTFKTLFNEVSNNEKKYTKESIIAYYNAVNNIMSLNVGNYFTNTNDSNVEGQVTSAAEAIKNAVNNYNTAVAGLTRQYKVTFKKAQADGGQNIKVIYVNGNTATKASVTEAAPKNTARWYDTTNHYDYSWTINDVTTDIDIYENRTATAHSYQSTVGSGDSTKYKASTCTESGFYYNVCSCGYEYLVNTNPLGHSYESTVGSTDSTKYKAPTCTEDGFHYMVCQRCNDTYIVIDGKLDHDWGTGVSNGDGTHKQTCSRDDSHTQDLPCNMVENADGTEATCSECGYTTTIVKLDRTAYNEALANANAVLENEKAKYSADSLSELQAVLVQAGKDALAAKTQEELNDVTSRITAANSTDTENGGVLVANTFRITYGNMFSFDDFMNSDSKDCATDNGKEKGTIGFDIDNQVFTVTSNEKYSDVYSAFGGAGTYKIPVSDSKSYTFEFTAKGALKNQVHVFFYNENGTALQVGENYTYLYNGAEQTTKSTDYFVCKYDTRDGETTKLTFTPPKGTVRVDVRFGVTTTSTSASFYNIGFYETAMVENLVLADGVVYGTAFDEVAIRQPEIDGMHFGGWFVDKELKTSASTLTEITRNVNIYAKLDALKVKDVVGCTLIKHGYTTYVCSDKNCSTDVVYTSYDDQILDGTTNGYWDAYNKLVALVSAEESNSYPNYTKASVDAVKSDYEALHETACASYNQSEVDGYANDMKAIINKLVVKVNFVTKTDGAVEQTNTVQVAYNGSLTAPTVASYTTVNGRYTWTFSSWDKEVVTSNITTGATYTAQYTRKDNLDTSAYYAAVESAEASIANTAKYTEDSRNALRAVLNNNTIKEDSTQTAVNNMANTIIQANNLKKDGVEGPVLELMTYTVTFISMKGNVEQSNTPSYHKYGEVAELEVADGGATVYKWVASDATDRKIAGATNRVSHYVTGNITIYAYIDDSKPVESETQYLVRVFNRVNKVVGYMYVAKDSQLTFESSTVTVGDDSVTIEKTPFYQIDGYTVDGKQILSGMTVTSNIDVYPVYKAQGEIVIDLDKTNYSNIKFTTSDEDRIKPLWDHKVTVVTTNNENVTWYVNNEAVAYGSSYTFRATQSMTIKAVKDATEEGSSTITYYAFDKDNNKARVTVSTYKSDKFVIKEQGILVLTSKTDNAEFKYDDFKTNGIKFVAKKTTDTGDQFSYSLNVGSSGIKTIGVVSYVVYDNGPTVYSKDYKTINVQ